LGAAASSQQCTYFFGRLKYIGKYISVTRVILTLDHDCLVELQVFTHSSTFAHCWREKSGPSYYHYYETYFLFRCRLTYILDAVDFQIDTEDVECPATGTFSEYNKP
jgi:hypothetical protein